MSRGNMMRTLKWDLSCRMSRRMVRRRGRRDEGALYLKWEGGCGGGRSVGGNGNSGNNSGLPFGPKTSQTSEFEEEQTKRRLEERKRRRKEEDEEEEQIEQRRKTREEERMAHAWNMLPQQETMMWEDAGEKEEVKSREMPPT